MTSRAAYLASTLSTAMRENLLSGGERRRRYLREVGRQPVEAAAAALLAGLPEVELADLVDLEAVPDVAVASAWGRRGSWSLGASERVVLQALVAGRGVREVFEIGTYDGGTTAVLAEALPEDGHVVTLDLPPGAFDASQSPVDLDGHGVGSRFRASPAASRVTQLLEDSTAFDPAPYAGRFDLVVVDGAHDLEHGLVDTRTALRVVAPGGVIVFDDFTAYWAGLVRGIVTAAAGRGLARLAGTDLGVIVTPEVAQG
ncbi:O-methyltransferase [Jatrophihabitans sp. YIM 134969]